MVFAALFPVLFVTSDRASAQQRFMADKVVAVVGNSSVLYSEVEEMSKTLVERRREQGYTSDRDPMCEALETLVIQRLLYNQAQLDSLKVQQSSIASAVESQIEQEIAAKGSVAALEAYYHKPIFNLREDMRQMFEEMQYAQQMQNTVKEKVTITPGEVERYYKSIPRDSLPLVPEQYVYAHIVVFPPSAEEAKLRTRERLLDMRERIANGTKFEALARMYSEDPSSAIRGGELDLMTREQLSRPFGDALVKLKEGQISEVVETEYGFHIIQMIERRGNQFRFRHVLLKPQYTQEEMMKASNKIDSLIRDIKAGKLTFEKAAARHSQDPYSRENGGIVTNHEMLEAYNYMDAHATSFKFLKEELNTQDYQVLRNMQPGDISEAFFSQDMRGNVLSKAVMLKEVVPAHPASLKEDYLRVEDMALEHKKEVEFDKWLNKKIAGMYIRIDDRFRGCDFQYKALLK